MVDYTLPLDSLPDPLPIEPLRRPFDATITPPGSKSITCRSYVLAALAEGESRLLRPLRADDTDRLLDALVTLGAEARWEGDDVVITGVGGRFPRGGAVNLGDGGTPARFMIACACLAAEPVVVDGSKRMRGRPVAEGVEMLRRLGARIDSIEAEGRLPVRVACEGSMSGGRLAVSTTQSSQFISAVLLIAPFLREGLAIRLEGPVTSRSYVELTRSVLAGWGVRSNDALIRAGELGDVVTIPAQTVSGGEHFIQPDASSAVSWWTAAAMVTNASVRTPGIGGSPKQPDTEYAHRALRNMGVRTFLEGGAGIADAAVGVRGGFGFLPHRPSIDMSLMPDAAMSLAVLIAVSPHATTITGLRTLRVKETDRIAALANELTKVGCEVEATEDSIMVRPMGEAQRAATVRERSAAGRDEREEPLADGRGSSGVVIETYNDHRMAMAFAVLGLVRPGIHVRNPACVGKSYPGFWKDFGRLYGER